MGLNSKYLSSLKLNSSTYNKHFIYKKGNDKFHVKLFHKKERFNCELNARTWFILKGYVCPPINSYNEKSLQIISKYIDGETLSKRNLTNYILPIQILSKIYKDSNIDPLRFDLCKIKYINNILYFLQLNNLYKLIKHIDQIHYLIVSNFHATLFKDAKPDNWLFSGDNSIFMLDFDYVKPSFFLSDLAQMCGYLYADNPNLDLTQMLDIFLTEAEFKNKLKLYIPLFYLSLICSNTIKCAFSKNEILTTKLKYNIKEFAYIIENSL